MSIEYQGHLRKMSAQLNDGKVDYSLRLDEQQIPLNEYIGANIQIVYSGEIHCLHCGRLSKKSFNQGYCFPCCRKLAACDTCIIKPEQCHYDQGTCREPSWGEQHCMIEHVVYLSNTSGLKVGITRHSQIPTRWIDQGAIAAIPLYRVEQRYHAGLIEVLLAKSFSDKTNWRAMLKGEVSAQDLVEKRTEIHQQFKEKLAILAAEHNSFVVTESSEAATAIDYPVEIYPQKISSVNLDKNPEHSGILQGIKGQYLLMNNAVINLRKYTSYNVKIALG